ncbi:MAG: hypothetical protein D6761_09775 [Candidatus Dadabacteria bacterium]|nr:MAG: hypothetical protein D6761_09775 [Candidatus Dadabacteria bacterium]
MLASSTTYRSVRIYYDVPMNTRTKLTLLAIALGGLSCTTDRCRPELVTEPAGTTHRIPDNSSLTLTAVVRGCADAAPTGDIRWYWDNDGDQQLTGDESLPVASTPTYTAYVCEADRGTHLLRVEAGLSAPTEPGEATLSRDLLIEVVPRTESPARPACVADALATIRNAGEITSANVARTFAEAQQCLAEWTAVAPCDFEATYGAALAELALFAGRIPERWQNRAQLSVSDVVDIAEQELNPLGERLALLDARAPDSFSFRVDGKFQLRLFDDLPWLRGNENVDVLLQGEHDIADIHLFAALTRALRGGAEILLAYQGLIDFGLSTPRLDRVNPQERMRAFLTEVEQNPEFLTFNDEATPDAATRLQTARGLFVDAIRDARQGLDTVARETDNQIDDIVRYWDCGRDGVCDCNNRDEIVFQTCPNDDGVTYSAPDDDGSEGNQRYDRGEPVGSDRLAVGQFLAIDLPSDISRFRAQLQMVAENLAAGAPPLDLDELVGLPDGTLRNAVFNPLDLPYPQIRLSQWFDSPTPPRDLIPLYSRSERTFLFDIESEAWDDAGYDGVTDVAESIRTVTNPEGLDPGTRWDPLDNPDPHFDNFRPLCTPTCNFNDGTDNDADGLIDDDDRVVINQFGVSIALPQELGVEGNLMFDWVDLNGNHVHDATEPSEPFDDTGVQNHRGELVNRPGAWDYADREHPWPSGADVGPGGGRQQTDPANGTDRDIAARQFALSLFGTADEQSRIQVDYPGLYDPFYLFLPDPTFSGVLTFLPNEIQGLDGRFLTDNATLFRFANKLLEFGNLILVGQRTGDNRTIAPLNLGGHICANETACRAAAR